MTDLAEALSFSPLTIPADDLKAIDVSLAFPGILIATVGIHIQGELRAYPDWKAGATACRNLIDSRKAGGSRHLLLMVVNDPAAELDAIAAEGLPLGLLFLQTESKKQVSADPYKASRIQLLTDRLLVAPSSRAGSPNLIPC